MSEALHDAHELHGVPERVQRPERGVDLPRPIGSRLAEVGKVLAVPAEEVVAAGAPAQGGGVAEQGAEGRTNRGLFSTLNNSLQKAVERHVNVHEAKFYLILAQNIGTTLTPPSSPPRPAGSTVRTPA